MNYDKIKEAITLLNEAVLTNRSEPFCLEKFERVVRATCELEIVMECANHEVITFHPGRIADDVSEVGF